MDFSFDSVRTRMISNLQSKASWADVLFFSTNSRLVDAVSEGIAELASYDEHLTRQTRWDLATEKSSLVSQSQFMQYDSHRKVGGTGIIRVSASESFDTPHPTYNVAFPKWTVFSDGIKKFTTTEIATMTPTDNYIDIPIVQGEPKTFNYVAAGDTYEEILITNSIIEDVYYEVYVESVLWTQVDDLNSAASIDNVYTLKNKLNFDGIEITFGNDIFGTKLQTGWSVSFKYSETLGVTGNVLGVDIITTVDSTIYDTNSAQVDIYCKNTGNIEGGKNEEDIEDIRTNGTDTFQAGDKAVAQKDYRVKLKKSPYILKATVWGAYEYNLDNNVDLWTYIPTEENVVRVSAFTPLGEQLDTAQKNEVIASIKEDKPPTDIVSFVDTDFIYLAFHIEAFVEDASKVLSTVTTEIIDGLTDRYSLNNLDFKQPMYEVDWKGYVKNIDGVTYHTSYLDMIKYSTFNEAYLGDLNLDIFAIDPSTIQLYIKEGAGSYIHIGTDDGVGGFTPEAGYVLTGSSINYVTGEGVINVVSGLSGVFGDYTIKTYYKTDAINIELKTRNQIFKIEEITDVESTYITE